jgi:hypothetical protein
MGIDEHIQRLRDLDNRTSIEKVLDFARDPMRDMQHYLPSESQRQAERLHELVRTVRSAPQANAENLQQAVRDHVISLQSNLATDEQLLVCAMSSLGLMLVHQIGFPNWHTIVLLGKDTECNDTSMVVAVNTVQLTYKVVKVQAPQKPYVIGFLTPETA